MRAIACCAIALATAGAAFAQETATYAYDVHGRLISVDRSTGADTVYAYDNANNRTSKITTGASLLLQQGAEPSANADPPQADGEDQNQGAENPPER